LDFNLPKKNEKLLGKHPTQNPLSLMNKILLSVTKGNNLVLDPFNGGGTTGAACIFNKRKYIGVELEKSYTKLTKQRIKT